MVCGERLEYLETGKDFVCNLCNKSETGNVYCLKNHYVCDFCHGNHQYDNILKLILAVKGKNPVDNAEYILRRASLPMLGCEHAWVTAGALISAIKNMGTLEVSEKQIVESLSRTRKQAIGAYCGLTGVCGIAPAMGAVFSVLLGAACPKDAETTITMEVVGETIIALSKETGPCCCKNFMRTALDLAIIQAEKHLGVILASTNPVVCFDSHRHPHGCRELKCNYYRV